MSNRLREGKTQLHAFEVYRDLGYNRSFREVGRRIGIAPNTVGKWSKVFGWDERLRAQKEELERREAAGEMSQVDDPTLRRMRGLLAEVESLIDSAFEPDITGKKVPKIQVKSADDLIRVVGEYRRILETYYKILTESQLGDKDGKDKSTRIGKMTVVMSDLTQEERIKLIQGVADGDVKSGNTRPKRGCQEADYREVSQRGDADQS